MESEKTVLAEKSTNSTSVLGSGSVAHQIIGEFLSTLEGVEDYCDIAKNLRAAILDEKPTEAVLRSAMFGEDSI